MIMSRMLVAVATLLIVTASAEGARLSLKDLPATVRQAVQAQTKDSTIRAISVEQKNGVTFYEVETTTLNGVQRDLLFSADGALSETEQLLATKEWPRPVVDAMRKDGRIKSIERLVKGSEITYEVTVAKNGREREIEVRADGTIVNGK
jgi:uncharacterized membrane protein YkoI